MQAVGSRRLVKAYILNFLVNQSCKTFTNKYPNFLSRLGGTRPGQKVWDIFVLEEETCCRRPRKKKTTELAKLYKTKKKTHNRGSFVRAHLARRAWVTAEGRLWMTLRFLCVGHFFVRTCFEAEYVGTEQVLKKVFEMRC